jgi:hypothetical protein
VPIKGGATMQQTTTEVQRLPEEVTNIKAGIRGLKATLVERTDTKAWYKRSDGEHEIFKIQIKPAGKVYGKHYPEREIYPNNEAFGKWAWCYPNEKGARQHYLNLP